MQNLMILRMRSVNDQNQFLRSTFRQDIVLRNQLRVLQFGFFKRTNLTKLIIVICSSQMNFYP